MATRSIQSFFWDEENHLVARLSCGHTQHMRHRPPFENRSWTQFERGREEMLKTPLDCAFCDMPTLPPDAEVYKRTPEFTAASLPPGLRKQHSTKAGVWGRLIVMEGRVLYTIEQPHQSWVLRPGVNGIIEPEREHHVGFPSDGRFYVEFLKRTGK